ncbi:MAG: hypothetical protein L7T87_04205, partial [Schleiferiaceae bacterium]|nr:hypothetical protein [Schleiferiaceae bacterium]
MELSPQALEALRRIRLDKRWISSTPQPVLVELVRDWLAYRRLIGPPQKRPSKPSSLDENKAKRQTTERDVTELFLEIINGYDEEEARDKMLALSEDKLKEGWTLMMADLLGPTNAYLPVLGTMFNWMLSPELPRSFTLEIEGEAAENPDPSEFLVDILWSYYSNDSMKHMEINHFTDELF